MTIFAKDYIPAPILVSALDQQFSAWEEWEPETLWAELGEVSDSSRAAIMAAKTLRANPEAYYTDLNGFEDITLGLNGTQPDFAVVEVCSPGEILLGVRFARKIVPPSSFTKEVVSYVQACFAQHGVYAYPRDLISFEPDKDKERRDRIRVLADSVSADVVHTDLESVQAAKLHDVMAHVAGWVEKAKESLSGAA